MKSVTPSREEEMRHDMMRGRECHAHSHVHPIPYALPSSLTRYPLGVQWICGRIAAALSKSYPLEPPASIHFVISKFLFDRFYYDALLHPRERNIVSLKTEINVVVSNNLSAMARFLAQMFSNDDSGGQSKSFKWMTKINGCVSFNQRRILGFAQMLSDVSWYNVPRMIPCDQLIT